MVGRAWCRLLESESVDHVALTRPQFDLLDEASIDQAFSERYDLVINAAAWTDVDGAETQEAAATRANAHAVERIAQNCARTGAFLITYSTDYVFNGKSDTPYPIDAPIDPINAYGRSKALGESLLRETTPNHLLIRTSWVHAPWGKNFVLTMRSLMTSRDQLQVVDDQHGRPTNANALAQGSLDLYRAGSNGTWHLTDGGECTWFGLANEIRSQLNSRCEVTPCTSEAFPRPAARPAYSTLDLSPTERLIGDRPKWKSGVRDSLV
jgi:dTDP-4-dehydrorhamnose reductase